MCRIIAALSLEERGLFKERIKVLDKRIHPGLTKLTWASKNVSDYFVAECRLHASKIQANVDDYKGANMSIRELCVKISEMLFMEKSTVNRNITRLIDNQYLSLDSSLFLHTTTKGKLFLEEVLPHWEIAMNEIHDILGQEGTAAVALITDKLTS